jgi:hypothetical protein
MDEASAFAVLRLVKPEQERAASASVLMIDRSYLHRPTKRREAPTRQNASILFALSSFSNDEEEEPVSSFRLPDRSVC